MTDYYSIAELNAMDAGTELYDRDGAKGRKLDNGDWTFINGNIGLSPEELVTPFPKPEREAGMKANPGPRYVDPTLEQLLAVRESYRTPWNVLDAHGDVVEYVVTEGTMNYIDAEIDKRIGYDGE